MWPLTRSGHASSLPFGCNLYRFHGIYCLSVYSHLDVNCLCSRAKSTHEILTGKVRCNDWRSDAWESSTIFPIAITPPTEPSEARRKPREPPLPPNAAMIALENVSYDVARAHYLPTSSGQPFFAVPGCKLVVLSWPNSKEVSVKIVMHLLAHSSVHATSNTVVLYTIVAIESWPVGRGGCATCTDCTPIRRRVEAAALVVHAASKL